MDSRQTAPVGVNGSDTHDHSNCNFKRHHQTAVQNASLPAAEPSACECGSNGGGIFQDACDSQNLGHPTKQAVPLPQNAPAWTSASHQQDPTHQQPGSRSDVQATTSQYRSSTRHPPPQSPLHGKATVAHQWPASELLRPTIHRGPVNAQLQLHPHGKAADGHAKSHAQIHNIQAARDLAPAALRSGSLNSSSSSSIAPLVASAVPPNYASLRLNQPRLSAAKQKALEDAKKMQARVLAEAAESKTDPPPYVLEELVGKGSYGRVYRARKRLATRNKTASSSSVSAENHAGQIVAIKIIDIEASDRANPVPRMANSYQDFLKEVEALRRLESQGARNINHIIEFLGVGRTVWMVTQYCGGGIALFKFWEAHGGSRDSLFMGPGGQLRKGSKCSQNSRSSLGSVNADGAYSSWDFGSRESGWDTMDGSKGSIGSFGDSTPNVIRRNSSASSITPRQTQNQAPKQQDQYHPQRKPQQPPKKEEQSPPLLSGASRRFNEIRVKRPIERIFDHTMTGYNEASCLYYLRMYNTGSSKNILMPPPPPLNVAPLAQRGPESARQSLIDLDLSFAIDLNRPLDSTPQITNHASDPSAPLGTIPDTIVGPSDGNESHVDIPPIGNLTVDHPATALRRPTRDWQFPINLPSQASQTSLPESNLQSSVAPTIVSSVIPPALGPQVQDPALLEDSDIFESNLSTEPRKTTILPIINASYPSVPVSPKTQHVTQMVEVEASQSAEATNDTALVEGPARKTAEDGRVNLNLNLDPDLRTAPVPFCHPRPVPLPPLSRSHFSPSTTQTARAFKNGPPINSPSFFSSTRKPLNFEDASKVAVYDVRRDSTAPIDYDNVQYIPQDVDFSEEELEFLRRPMVQLPTSGNGYTLPPRGQERHPSLYYTGNTESEQLYSTCTPPTHASHSAMPSLSTIDSSLDSSHGSRDYGEYFSGHENLPSHESGTDYSTQSDVHIPHDTENLPPSPLSPLSPMTYQSSHKTFPPAASSEALGGGLKNPWTESQIPTAFHPSFIAGHHAQGTSHSDGDRGELNRNFVFGGDREYMGRHGLGAKDRQLDAQFEKKGCGKKG
ncbi:hypothetical protein CFIMG_004414RAa [Ceratocystis fimbriata CBS 114723]|uniref:Protein kinase domain-containing protein n=1 Tax=Ceratocystis fimbriata CBS 114723 TaxID=1035309 RepID=A0A2C5WTK6_9PEZI|nr:hypothetical protein CFIMG_004414RAa [Ceratocystis fimbriata CBS 114723]